MDTTLKKSHPKLGQASCLLSSIPNSQFPIPNSQFPILNSKLSQIKYF
ncbi:MAG: hypothetical protein F6K41_01975 [Symploca sp. SIO3E6]|nr:hypothetical protein [Caldora sp. SIO3E6]